MVGTAPEDEAYALEVTYNYGVVGYERGTALAGFDVYVDDPDAALAAAAHLGYSTVGGTTDVLGPDGYAYRVLPRPVGRREPFRAVRFVVPDPVATAEWYARTLGAEVRVGPLGSATVAFLEEGAGNGVQNGVVFRFDVGPKAVVVQFDGRNAFSLPAVRVREIYAAERERRPKHIVHELQEIDEETGLGVLLIAIVTDVNGLELCLVSSEAFEPAIRDAVDYRGPDYGAREQLALDYAKTVARAKKQKPGNFGWAAEF